MDEGSPSNGGQELGNTWWRPRELSFRPYTLQNEAQSLRVVVRKSELWNRLSTSAFAHYAVSKYFGGLRRWSGLVARLTKDIVETYQICNPQFKFSEDLNPKRYLTTPSVGVLNDGYDNANSDLILSVNYALVNLETHRRYIVKDVLGHGTFGQVARCLDVETNSFVAVKIIKNQPAYYQQALVEVSILTTLNRKYDPEDKHHIVRIYDYFVHQRHLCICFELLDTNLGADILQLFRYELIKINQFRGLSLSIVQLFSKQILRGLALLKDAGIIHCDLKPENILLCTSVKPAEIKIIDFGSACMEDRTVYSYIQSRYYRSPEVLLGYQYSTAIDMWSFGCIVAELFLGLPLFPGASEFDLLRRMIQILGYGSVFCVVKRQPPDYVLKEAKNTSKFFKCVGIVHNMENDEVAMDGRSTYQPLTEIDYEAREMKKPLIAKEYFNQKTLEAIVTNYPYKKNLTKEDIFRESQIRLALVDFLKGLVEFDPAKRWSPFQASKHPFVTGEPFTCPYIPPLETPRVPVAQNIKVDHHPGAGHWFAAGLSPNVPGRNRFSLHNSPHFPVVPYAHGNSYGSVGSYGSYNDGTGLGSSYGSYGDSGGTFAYFSPMGPSGMNMHPQSGVSVLGSSPDARKRIIQYSHGNGLGLSPSAGMFVPLPLGTSPSQFTPPSSYGQVSAGSPGHYGPPSPARNSCHGSSFGKVAAVSHYNRRKSWGYSGNPQSQECSSSQQWQGQFIDNTSTVQAEGQATSQLNVGSPSHLQSNPSAASWKQRGSSGITANSSAMQNMPSSSTRSSNIQVPHSAEAAHDKSEASQSLPDPGDWDPNYSELTKAQRPLPRLWVLVALATICALTITKATGSCGLRRTAGGGEAERRPENASRRSLQVFQNFLACCWPRTNGLLRFLVILAMCLLNSKCDGFSHSCFSDEQLLQEDGSDESCITTEFSKGLHLGLAESSIGVGRVNRISSTSSNLPNQRQNGPIQAFSHVEVGSPPSAHDPQAGFTRFMSKPSHLMPHNSQNSPSRLGQPPAQRFNYMRPTAPQGSEWNQNKFQPPSSFNSGGPRSPGSSSFNNGMPWGRRANNPISNIPPASRGRKDYGRIV
ncbi:hypothetical protein EZV62_024662 [Acer yangbiense]|uniref:Protein kinase domain-containing protein n=1 Tax=Acer yangbiense TaxID=1000413 RepID=A0A5C7GWA5_9ROSI|nr:hypothetical protein EZV62_024662 [Acer yangbiense]